MGQIASIGSKSKGSMLKKMQGMFKKSGSAELPESGSPNKSAKLSDAP